MNIERLNHESPETQVQMSTIKGLELYHAVRSLEKIMAGIVTATLAGYSLYKGQYNDAALFSVIASTCFIAARYSRLELPK